MESVIIAHPSLGVVDLPAPRQRPVGQAPIPGGVFGSAGANVAGTFWRKYDPTPDRTHVRQTRVPGGVIGSVGGKSTGFVYPSHGRTK